MEQLYLVDSNDNVLGKIERKQAHKEGALHRAGMVFILNREMKLFILHRADKETFPNCYDASCSFHVPYGESYENAAMRELAEEIGIRVPLKFIGKFLHHDPPENQIVAVFVGYSNQVGNIDPKEASGGEWCDEERLKAILSSGSITPWLRDEYKVLKSYLTSRTG